MKLNLRPKALKLRRRGYSIADIARTLKISESTASLWCREVILSKDQKKKMEKRTNKKLKRFFKMVEKQKQKRVLQKKLLIKKSVKELGKISKRDIFIAGVALYWAEGFKHKAEGRIGFCNSDPAMIKFMINFLISHFRIKMEEISPRLTINESFKNRERKIIEFWADYLKIPASQFTKSFYQKVKLVKIFENPENYHGVLRIHVRKSSKLLIEMRGYLEGLKLFAEQG